MTENRGGESRGWKFQAAFCRVFFLETFDLDLVSDLFLLGEEDLEPLTEFGLEIILVLLLVATLVFSFLPLPSLFFFCDVSTVLFKFVLEFCLLSLPELLATDWECLGEIAFLVCLESGLPW